MGHFFYPHPVPVTETQKHSAYPGCYALSKVLEEVMLEQYYIQYDLNGCCLRAPWIMEKDDFKYQLSFGDDVFGGPRWRDLVGAKTADAYVEERRGAGDARRGRPAGEAQLRPRRRSGRARSCAAHRPPAGAPADFNICMDEPVDYGELGAYLAETRGLPTRADPHAVPLDLARQHQGEVPARLAAALRSEADGRRRLDYKRAADDPRVVWYPG